MQRFKRKARSRAANAKQKEAAMVAGKKRAQPQDKGVADDKAQKRSRANPTKKSH